MAKKRTSKKELLAQEIARAVGAGRAVAVETVDFSDPNRPKTCLEVDFPILPINQIAVIEGNAGKPIYQMSKWWARRRSSVFRSLLLAAAMKAPDDPGHAAKVVWDVYYANHQRKGALKHLKVADIFMGGGTTLVEGSRLGMQMFGVDLNPVAWFVVKQQFSKVDLDEVKRLLADIEAEVKPQVMPFYCCDGPNGEKGKWTHVPTGQVMGEDFDPLALKPEERKDYEYEGPEIICTFWAKHGPCQVTGCGHRTPIMTSPVMTVKTLTVKSWKHTCSACGTEFDVEQKAARMAPDVPLYVAPTEKPFSVLDLKRGVVCPKCGHAAMIKFRKSQNKKVGLSLLVHPQWLAGSPKADAGGRLFGGSAQDDAASTARWNQERARKIRLLEVRGELPGIVTCPDTKATFKTGKEGGTVPKKSSYACGACGTVQDVLATVKASGKTGPMAAYAIQGYAPGRDASGTPYNGRFLAPFDEKLARQYDAACREWEQRKDTDLTAWWPRSALPYGLEADFWSVRHHGYSHWWTMFNLRQLLVHSQLLKGIVECGNDEYSWSTREYVMAAFQQYLRNQCMFTLWNPQRDTLEPQFSKNNFRPKTSPVENCVFSNLGRGNWYSCCEALYDAADWKMQPWEILPLRVIKLDHSGSLSQKVCPGDGFAFAGQIQTITECQSATDLENYESGSIDLVITDPPFGDLLQYAELSDFFYVWLRLGLARIYPSLFGAEESPKALEVVSNKAREAQDPDGFYKRLLTACWREAHRILKPGGILAFTFHHSEDEPWVAVLESLFDAGFYLQATYPIRSDETKGEGQFGSQKIEYDIIHVCRKRTEEPKPVSWGRMRREVLADVRQLQALLENHAKEGLPAADLQVIRRGKALEYFSRHYGKVYVDEGRTISVKDALVGINQLIDEDANRVQDPPPVNAEPITRQFLRIFDGKTEVARDQMQKFLRGSGVAPDEFVDRGWCVERKKVFHLAEALNFARSWQGRHRRNLTFDYDQAWFLIGTCFDGSGINASDTLKNEHFKPHPALKGLLEWQVKRGANQPTRNAASRALTLYNTWAASHQQQVRQMALFFEEASS